MKSSWKLISAVAIVAFAVSCTTSIDPTPKYEKSNSAFAITSSTNTLAAAASDSLNTVLTLFWQDPKFSVGIDKSKFTVYLGVAGTGFKSFVTKSFSGVTQGALIGKEVNGAALKLGGVIGQPISLDVKVVASQTNNDEQIESNTLQISVTPYGDLGLSAKQLTVICTAAKATQAGDTLIWTTAFNGYTGVKTYQLQYAKGGTNFANPVSESETLLQRIFTVRELNLLAQSVGIAAATTGNVDFRVKATNESGTVVYSNTVTISVTTYVAYNSIGIIGDFTSWSNDVDLYRPDPVNAPGDWTVTLYIGAGGVKFRADDAWTDNWGDSAFPSGTGTSGGANIPIATAGYYKVNFNAVTHAYTFTALSPATYTTPGVSLIGDFNSWSSDLDLTADASGHIWTGTVTIASDGNIKLRADHSWNVNWGNTTFPSGYGTNGGPNIPIKAGTYFVWFNDVSGEYMFGPTANSTPYNSIGAIGDFNGWSADANLIKNPDNAFKWSAKITLDFGSSGSGSMKFRANAAWSTNWGAGTFPTGVGVQDGANIPAISGTYQITFNSLTGEYSFTN